MSETATSRDIFAPYCKGLGIDVGFGFDAVTKDCLTSDMKQPYTAVGNDKQIFQNDCRDFSFICDECLDFFHTSHLLEDFRYAEVANILKEWRRCLKPGGLILINCPDQQKFLAHCAATGQGLNLAHKEQDFSLQNFKDKSLAASGSWEILMENDNHGPYSWLLIVKKI